ncbi:MAG: DUF2939 domain-containing protein [Comamonadaceae bacterium]|nr:DUF2939 domain-containing protein [Comamonadaceae bacterium]
MQAAAKAQDADGFNDHVDYPKLRESLKGQFSAILAEKMGNTTDSGNPFAALGSMLGLAVVDKFVDAMVRPEMVMKGMQNGQFGPKAQQSSGDAGDSSQPSNAKEGKPRWTYERKGFDKLIAYSKDEAETNEKKVGLVFERSGFFNWKLTEIRLPSTR